MFQVWYISENLRHIKHTETEEEAFDFINDMLESTNSYDFIIRNQSGEVIFKL